MGREEEQPRTYVEPNSEAVVTLSALREKLVQTEDRMHQFENANLDLRAQLALYKSEKSSNDDPERKQMYDQLKYKDNRIMELNNVIMEKERRIIDLQELCREQSQVAKSKKMAVAIVSRRLQELDERQTRDAATEVDATMLAAAATRLTARANERSSSQRRIESPGRAIFQNGRSNRLGNGGNANSSPPPIDPSEDSEFSADNAQWLNEDATSLSKIVGGRDRKSLSNRKRVTFDFEPQVDNVTVSAHRRSKRSSSAERGRTSRIDWQAENNEMRASEELSVLLNENQQLRNALVKLQQKQNVIFTGTPIVNVAHKSTETERESDQMTNIMPPLSDDKETDKNNRNRVLKARAAAQARIRELEENITNLQITSTKELENVMAINETLKTSREWLIKENADLLNKNEKLRTKVDDLHGELDSSVETNTLFRNRLDESERRVDALSAEVTDVRRSLHHANDTKQALLSEVERLKEALLAQNEFISVLEGDLIVYEAHVGILRDSLGASKKEQRETIKSKAYAVKLNALEMEKQKIVKRSNDDRLLAKALSVKVQCLEKERIQLLQCIRQYEQAQQHTRHVSSAAPNVNEGTDERDSNHRTLSSEITSPNDFTSETVCRPSALPPLLYPQARSAVAIPEIQNPNEIYHSPYAYVDDNEDISIETAAGFTESQTTQTFSTSSSPFAPIAVPLYDGGIWQDRAQVLNSQHELQQHQVQYTEEGAAAAIEEERKRCIEHERLAVEETRQELEITYQQRLENNLEEYEQRISAISSKLAELEAQNESLLQERAAGAAYKTEQEQKIMEIYQECNDHDDDGENTVTNKLDSIAEVIANFKMQLSNTETQRQCEMRNLKQLTQDLATARAKIRELESLKIGLTTLNDKLSDENNEITNKLETTNEALSAAEARLSTTEHSLNENLAHVQQLEAELFVERERVAALSEAKQRAEFNLGEADKRLLEMMVDKENFVQKIATLQNNNSYLSATLEREKGRLERLVDLLRREVDRFRVEAELSRNCLEDLRLNAATQHDSIQKQQVDEELRVAQQQVVQDIQEQLEHQSHQQLLQQHENQQVDEYLQQQQIFQQQSTQHEEYDRSQHEPQQHLQQQQKTPTVSFDTFRDCLVVPDWPLPRSEKKQQEKNVSENSLQQIQQVSTDNNQLKETTSQHRHSVTYDWQIDQLQQCEQREAVTTPLQCDAKANEQQQTTDSAIDLKVSFQPLVDTCRMSPLSNNNEPIQHDVKDIKHNTENQQEIDARITASNIVADLIVKDLENMIQISDDKAVDNVNDDNEAEQIKEKSNYLEMLNHNDSAQSVNKEDVENSQSILGVSVSVDVSTNDNSKFLIHKVENIDKNQSSLNFSSENIPEHIKTEIVDLNATQTEQCDNKVSAAETEEFELHLLSDIEQLIQLKTELETSVDVLKSEIWSLNDQLRKQLCEQEDTAERLRVCESLLADADERLRQRDAEVEQLRVELTTNSEDFALVYSEKSKIEVKSSELVQKCTELEQTLAEKEHCLEELTEAQRLFDTLKTCNAELSKSLNEERVIVANLRTELEKSTADLSELSDEKAKIHAQSNKLLEQLNKLQASYELLAAKTEVNMSDKSVETIREDSADFNSCGQQHTGKQQRPVNDTENDVVESVAKTRSLPALPASEIHHATNSTNLKNSNEVEQAHVGKEATDSGCRLRRKYRSLGASLGAPLSASCIHPLNMQLAILAARLDAKSADAEMLMRTNAELTHTNTQLLGTVEELESRLRNLITVESKNEVISNNNVNTYDVIQQYDANETENVITDCVSLEIDLFKEKNELNTITCTHIIDTTNTEAVVASFNKTVKTITKKTKMKKVKQLKSESMHDKTTCANEEKHSDGAHCNDSTATNITDIAPVTETSDTISTIFLGNGGFAATRLFDAAIGGAAAVRAAVSNAATEAAAALSDLKIAENNIHTCQSEEENSFNALLDGLKHERSSLAESYENTTSIAEELQSTSDYERQHLTSDDWLFDKRNDAYTETTSVIDELEEKTRVLEAWNHVDDETFSLPDDEDLVASTAEQNNVLSNASSSVTIINRNVSCCNDDISIEQNREENADIEWNNANWFDNENDNNNTIKNDDQDDNYISDNEDNDNWNW